MGSWRYKVDGLEMGPVSSSELRALAASGRISPRTPVLKEGQATWTSAANVRGLFATELSRAPATPVAPPLPPPPSAPPPATAGAPTTMPVSEASRLAGVGRRLRSWRSIMVIGAATVAVAALAFVSYVGLRRSGVAFTDADRPQPAATGGSSPRDPYIDRSAGFKIRVSRWGYQDRAGRSTAYRGAIRPSGLFLWFGLQVTNERDETARIAPDIIKLRDGQGRTYLPSVRAMRSIDSAPWTQDYPPGVSVAVELFFDVPRPPTGTQAEAAEAGYELVIDFGFSDAQISVAAMHAAAVAEEQAFNDRFDRLMSAYDEASSEAVPEKSFEVHFGRIRWFAERDDPIAYPGRSPQRQCVAYAAGSIAVTANGVLLAPGWQRVPPAIRRTARERGIFNQDESSPYDELRALARKREAAVARGVANPDADMASAIDAADRALVAGEHGNLAPKSFLPFTVGWFTDLGPGPYFGDLDAGRTRFRQDELQEGGVQPQRSGFGSLDDAAIGWLRNAQVEGAANTLPPHALDSSLCRVVIDPFGFPVLVMFGSADQRIAFDESLRSSASSWGQKWRDTAAEYASLELGDLWRKGQRADARLKALREQGRPIDIRGRKVWLVPPHAPGP